MRGTKAKWIARTVAGQFDADAPRQYLIHEKTGQIVTDGFRRAYQAMKKFYKERNQP